VGIGHKQEFNGNRSKWEGETVNLE